MRPEASPADLERWEKWRDLRARKEAATTDGELAALAVEEEELRAWSIESMLEADLEKPERIWWLSFCDTDKPNGEQFLGVCLVRGGGMSEALQNAWTMGINPGGEVAAYEMPDEGIDHPGTQILLANMNKLMSEDELREAGLIE